MNILKYFVVGLGILKKALKEYGSLPKVSDPGQIKRQSYPNN
ncbi:hypothetical protein ACK8HY_02965 [Sphingobacterium sp. NGMCC 1.201703]|nr:hypothetical protein [Sphingobacterium sp. CZ-UAM]